ncbi:redoxin family protein [Henriciella aquimarina]|uniref:redoxin family protein n=1 Tax=Henriciella aquimarina TaxID=545261 RepID=UPI000A02A5A6|nr:redoxin family protein [Henriciella aquimarina]
MKRWQALAPLAALVGLSILGGIQLFRPSEESFVAKADRSAPDRQFPLLGDDSQTISFAPPPGEGPVMVNLFASWCAPCRAEHGDITALAEAHPGQVYGLAYKDNPAATRGFLQELGNPFTAIGVDRDGQGGLDFGLTGVPETFVISPEGKIILHVRGPLDEDRRKEVSKALEG